MPENENPFAPSPDRLSDLSNAILHGDPAGAVIAMRQQTELPLSDLAMTIMALAALLWAVAEVVKQFRPIAQPFADVAAERLRDAPDGPESTADKAGKP